MAVKHTKVSAIADGADPTVVRASDWNATHTIDNDTITYALMQNISATQRLIGRNAAGAGDPEEVTASQLFDWVSNTNGVLLTRAGGTWGAVSKVTVDNGELVMADDASVIAPAAGAKLFSKSLAGRSMPSFIGALNRASAVQPHLGQNKTGFWYMASTVLVSPWNVPVITTTGTGTQRTPASTNLCTSIRRVGWVSAAGANSIASLVGASMNWIWRGNAAGLGGFHIVMRFAPSDAALVGTANMFMGLGTTYTDVDPATLTNIVGIGCSSGDTVLQLYAAGAAAQTKTSLGALFPVNNPSVDVYELVLYADPNGSTITWRVERINTGDTAGGVISAAANLFSNTTFLRPVMGRSNGGTATAVGFDFISASFETDV